MAEPFKKGDATYVNIHELGVKLLSEHATAPAKGTDHLAGYDMYSAKNAIIPPHKIRLIHTDVALEIPINHFGQIKSRSSLALRDRIDVKVGTIDADYRGEIEIIISNKGNSPFTIQHGDRVAQIVIMKTPNLETKVKDELSTTTHDKNGLVVQGYVTKSWMTLPFGLFSNVS